MAHRANLGGLVYLNLAAAGLLCQLQQDWPLRPNNEEWLAGKHGRLFIVCCRFSHSWGRSIIFVLSSVFVDFLAVGCLVATIGW